MLTIHTSDQRWVDICAVEDLTPEAGCGALLEDQQVALFYLPNQPEQCFAIGNFDPLGGANVLSRGIVGNLGDRLVVASPLYKQHFDLRTGACLEDESVSVPCFSSRIVSGRVELATTLADNSSG
ncbi:MAG: nitrite reductase small subunit NirD [Immundisolibacteraceae bacterium]|nr:nitrite reductase small subunit NirD [Immundisolibacteraceae bacterium]